MRPKDPARVAAGLRAALANPNVSKAAKENAMRQLDGFATATAHAAAAAAAQRVGDEPQAHRVQENDDELDPETLRNTKSNERATRIQQKEEHSDDSNHKHVNFVDEAAARKLIAQQKSILRKPRALKADKAEARDFLEFHGEICGSGS